MPSLTSPRAHGGRGVGVGGGGVGGGVAGGGGGVAGGGGAGGGGGGREEPLHVGCTVGV